MGKTKTAFVSEVSEEKKAKKKEKKEVKAPGLKGGEKVAMVEGTKEEGEKKKAKKKEAKKRGKKYQEALTKIDKTNLYKAEKAISLIKETSYSSFDGTVEIHLVVKKEGLTAKVKMPFKAGKEKKIEVADEKTIENLKKGVVNFDILLATPEMMPKLVPFARILGPKGLMPNPKNGTVIKSKKEAENFSASEIILKTEKKQPVIHTSLGKVSQKDSELEKNLESVLEAIGKRQIIKAHLTSSMGPSVRLEVA